MNRIAQWSICDIRDTEQNTEHYSSLARGRVAVIFHNFCIICKPDIGQTWQAGQIYSNSYLYGLNLIRTQQLPFIYTHVVSAIFHPLIIKSKHCRRSCVAMKCKMFTLWNVKSQSLVTSSVDCACACQNWTDQISKMYTIQKLLSKLAKKKIIETKPKVWWLDQGIWNKLKEPSKAVGHFLKKISVYSSWQN